MTGYSGTPLPKKLGLKPGHRYALFNPPPGFEKQLRPLPEDTTRLQRPRKDVDLILLFAARKSMLDTQLARCKALLTTAGLPWIAWPKKASGVATDLDFNVVQKAGLKLGLVDNKVAAVDDTWSGLRFVYRLKDRRCIIPPAN